MVVVFENAAGITSVEEVEEHPLESFTTTE
jgi:hypothetical protein